MLKKQLRFLKFLFLGAALWSIPQVFCPVGGLRMAAFLAPKPGEKKVPDDSEQCHICMDNFPPSELKLLCSGLTCTACKVCKTCFVAYLTGKKISDKAEAERLRSCGIGGWFLSKVVSPGSVQETSNFRVPTQCTLRQDVPACRLQEVLEYLKELQVEAKKNATGKKYPNFVWDRFDFNRGGQQMVVNFKSGAIVFASFAALGGISLYGSVKNILNLISPNFYRTEKYRGRKKETLITDKKEIRKLRIQAALKAAAFFGLMLAAKPVTLKLLDFMAVDISKL